MYDEIFEKIYEGDLQTVLKEWPNLEKVKNYTSWWKINAINHAAHYGHLHIVKYFVEVFNIDLTNSVHRHGETTLIYASSSKKDTLEIIKYLYEKGVDIFANKNLALCWACSKGHLQTVKFLVEHGADINERINHNPQYPTAIQEAARKGFLPIVKYLFEKGAKHANLALKDASANNRLEIVYFLSQKGVYHFALTSFDIQYINFRLKMERKRFLWAVRKIYFWWIPICYDVNRDCGKRMMERSWERVQGYMSEI